VSNGISGTSDGPDTPARTAGSPTTRLALVAVLVAIIVAISAVFLVGLSLAPTDAYVYFAAGERLNAGHSLYALAPSDRIIGLNPPYWTVPTLSPPFMGVLWRPLAAIGIAGMFVGWIATGAAFLAAMAMIVYRAPRLGLAATVVLAVPIGWQLGLGNVNGLLLLGMVLLWYWRDRPWIAGGLVALMVAMKLTPVVFVAWLALTGRWRAVGTFAATFGVLSLISVAGAGWPAHLEYLGIAGTTISSGTTELSLAGLLRWVGVSPEVARLAPWVALVAGAAALVILRRRPAAAFAVAVGMLVFGSPVVQIYWYALLLAALAPWGPARPRFGYPSAWFGGRLTPRGRSRSTTVRLPAP
jgi:alpha-1,2-mannosyltransferase